MKIRVLALLALVVGVAVGLAGPVAADETATVTATVTPEQISVSVNPSTVDYGVVGLGTTDNVPSPAYFTATNNGAVLEDFAIRGANTTDWALVTTAPESDEYRHWFSNDTTYTALQVTVAEALEDSVAISGTVDVYLKLDTPEFTTTFDQQSAAVTVVAMEHSNNGVFD